MSSLRGQTAERENLVSAPVSVWAAKLQFIYFIYLLFITTWSKYPSIQLLNVLRNGSQTYFVERFNCVSVAVVYPRDRCWVRSYLTCTCFVWVSPSTDGRVTDQWPKTKLLPPEKTPDKTESIVFGHRQKQKVSSVEGFLRHKNDPRKHWRLETTEPNPGGVHWFLFTWTLTLTDLWNLMLHFSVNFPWVLFAMSSTFLSVCVIFFLNVPSFSCLFVS